MGEGGGPPRHGQAGDDCARQALGEGGRGEGVQPDDGEEGPSRPGRVTYGRAAMRPAAPAASSTTGKSDGPPPRATAPAGTSTVGRQGRGRDPGDCDRHDLGHQQVPATGHEGQDDQPAGDDRGEQVDDVPERLEAARETGEEVGEPRLDGGDVGGAGCGEAPRGSRRRPCERCRSGDAARWPSATRLNTDEDQRRRIPDVVTGEGSPSSTTVGSSVVGSGMDQSSGDPRARVTSAGPRSLALVRVCESPGRAVVTQIA